MKTSGRNIRGTRRRGRGIGLVEVMISLAICSMLLTAMAAALMGSTAAVKVNEDFFRATHGARVALVQLQSALRRCDQCSVPSNTRIDLITYDGKDRSYLFDAVKGQLLLVTNSSSTDPDYVLARNVSNVNFVADSEYYPGTTTSRVVRVTISFDMQMGDEKVHLSGSAVPRRAIVY